MPDVFLSFSGRAGITTDWITAFRDDVVKEYNAGSSAGLDIWDYIGRNQDAIDFRKEIDIALPRCMVLLVVLDPGYFKSPETRREVEQYGKQRTDAQKEPYIIKVVKRLGDKEQEIKTAVSTNYLQTFFSAPGPDGIEREYERGSKEYKEQVIAIAAKLKRIKREDGVKECARSIEHYLSGDTYDNIPKIYVAYTDAGPGKFREKFIKQLIETIGHHPDAGISSMRVLPDDFIGSTFEDLHGLFCKENSYRENILKKLLAVCQYIIIPFESKTPDEAKMLFSNFQYQLRMITAMIAERSVPVHILVNTPEEMYEDPDVRQYLLNPAYPGRKNIRTTKEQSAINFIDEFVKGSIIQPVPPPPPPDEPKAIYVIQNNEKGFSAKQREALRYIRAMNFELLRDEPDKHAFGEIGERRKRWIKESNAVLIFKGEADDVEWFWGQQAITWQIIVELKKKHILAKAVFVDGSTPIDETDFSFYGYDLITLIPNQLKDFLCKIK